jgi:nucleoside-diphosphate-sugar epimerase
VLVSGGNGFVAKALIPVLLGRGERVVATVRSLPARAGEVHIGDIDTGTDWSAVLCDCAAVVHLAARVHVMHDQTAEPLEAFRRVNTAGTLNLARQAANAGVRRFVFISTVKVNGDGCPSLDPCAVTRVYREGDSPAPLGAYAVSKWEAEQGLREIARRTGMDLVILRPPLVYGPGAGGNFLRLMRLVARGVPLPFAAVANRRSLLYVGNLVDAIAHCLAYPAAAGKTYLLSDGEDLSTPELVRRMALAMGRPARLLPLPVGVLRWVSGLLGKVDEAERLLGTLLIDSSAIRRDLDWRPPFSVHAGLAATAQWFGHGRSL